MTARVRNWWRAGSCFVVAVMLALAAVAGSASASPLYSMSGSWEPASVKGTAGLLEITMGESGTLSGKGSLGAAEVTSIGGLETSGGAVVVSLTEAGGRIYTGIGELGDSGECISGIAYDTDYATSKQLDWFVFVRQGRHPSVLETGNSVEPYVCAGTPESSGRPPYSLAGSWVPASGAPAPNASWSMDALGDLVGRGESEGGPTVVWGHLGESGNVTLLTGKPESPGYASFLTGITGDDGTCISGSSIDTRGFKESAVLVLAQDLGHVGLLNGGQECAGNSGAAKVGLSCSVFDPGTAGEYLQCTATVADATGEEPPRIPTGTVTFTSPSGGFPEGASCALGVDPTSRTAFCAVRYVPATTIATGATVAVGARYSGDSYFSAASGSAAPTVASAAPAEHQVSLVPPQDVCTAAISFAEPVLYSGGAAASAASLMTISPFARLSVTARAQAPVAALARRGRRISPAAIRARALAILDPRARHGRGGIAIYRLPSPLPTGATVSEALAGATPMRPVKLHSRTWIYWADLAPGARFGHPSVLLLLDARSGRIVAQQRLSGYPLLSGRRAAFVHAGHPRRYVVYARLPHVAIARSAGRRILAARTFAAHEAAVWRSRARRAAATGKAALITLVSQETSEPFAAEGQAISGVFSSNGIPTYSAKTQSDLRTALNEATAAGARNVTLFLDSHGTSPEKTRYYKEGPGGTHEHLTLTELLALDPSKLPPNVKTETYIGEPELLLGGGYKPAELKAFLEEHPEVKFNIIITACYSGAFIPTLSTVSNVTSVTTSSSGNEPTVGGYDEETVNGVNVTLTAPPGVRSDIAPFVAAEAYALQQAFTAAGPSADVAGVVKTAQQTEAQYDAGAISGLEHPSVPWVTTQTGSGGGSGTGTRGCNAPMEPDGEVDATASPVSPTGEANA